MATEIKIYKIKDFIRISESGDIDLKKSMQLAREIASVSSFNYAHNIILYLRNIKVPSFGMEEVMKITMEFTACMPSFFSNKIANVIPNDENRAALAKKF